MEFWPHGLNGMGTDAGGLLKKLESYGYRFYDINPKEGKPLPRVEPAELVAALPIDRPDLQADLLALRGGREPPTE
jgi:hypothetical protein